MYIVGFNGPPRAGKDTMVQMFLEHMDSQGCTIPVIETTPTVQLFQIACAMTGWEYNLATYEEFKATHFDLFGKDGRQLMIDVSEEFLKPTYGESVKAKMTLASLGDFHGLVVFSSLGFQMEADVFIDAVGAENLYVVRVERPGYDFTNDSREWVTHRQMGAFFNAGDLDYLRSEAIRLHEDLLAIGW